MKNGVSVIAMVLIASFVIDRLVAAVFFLLSFSPSWRGRFGDAGFSVDSVARSPAERVQKLVYFAFATLFALGILSAYPQLLVLNSLGIGGRLWADRLFTLLVLVGGADRVAAIVGLQAGARDVEAAQPPIRVTGTLTLEERGSSGDVSAGNP